ncbi:MAG: ubiquitin-like domain-containing protein [Candidatus Saccharimonadales bacterium]
MTLTKKNRAEAKLTAAGAKHPHVLHRAVRHPAVRIPLLTFSVLLLLVVAALLVFNVDKSAFKPMGTSIVIITDDGKEQTIPTRARTVGDLLERQGIALNEGDVVEPSQDTEITSDNFRINVYRATPVTIVDGARKIFTFSAAATPRSIVKQAGIEVYPEDELLSLPTENFLIEGSIGPRIVIARATPVNINLYGTQVMMRTRAKTVGELLKERDITLGSGDTVTPTEGVVISPNMQIFLLRQGQKIETVEEEIPMPVERIADNTLSIGTKAIRQQGAPGKRAVTYQIQLENDLEVARTQIQSIEVVPAVKHIEAFGTRSVGGLSKSKGVYFFTDSRGITHRETYYDLPMGGVMRFCGGSYSVRADGAKVDKDGYILVAANLSLYPRCSVVETSLGLGRVYDTGDFTRHHPHGFDLATDWSNNDGR